MVLYPLFTIEKENKMYIGLFDQDLLVTPNTFIPSLELMKYSYYYKMNKNIVKMIYDANAISPFDKVIVSSNIRRKLYLPKLLMTNPKVEWIGTTFFNAYSRLPFEIENCEADKSIYETFYRKNKDNFSNKQKSKLGTFLNSGVAYRLTHNGEIIFDYEKVIVNKNKIYLYDEDIFSCQEILKQIPKFQTERGICFLKPQKIYDFDIFLKSKSDFPKCYPYSNSSPIFIYVGELTKKEFIKHYLDLSPSYCLGITDKKRDNESWNDFGFRQFLTLGNYYFYSISKKRKITFVKNPNVPDDSDGVKLLNGLCRLTRIGTPSSDYNLYQFLKKDGYMIDKIYNKYRFDSPVNKILTANLKQICQCGVWVL